MADLLYHRRMKTSSRISLQFTLLVAVIAGILLGIINSVFLYWWITTESQNITQFVVLKNLQPSNPITNSLQRQERVMAFPQGVFNPNDFPTFWLIKRIRLFDNRRWIVGKNTDYYILLDVSQNINRQIGLLYISGLSWLAVLLLSFIVSRFFIHTSLRDLRGLSKKVKNRDVENSIGKLSFDHLPHMDEINSIARAIEWLEQRIQWHYSNLRTFVSNVSHELKTPLMIMRSEVDLAERSKEYSAMIENVRSWIKDMQSTIDSLLTLTRLQAQNTIKKETINIVEIVQDVIDMMNKKHHSKNLNITFSHSSREGLSHIEWNEQLVKILISNIIDNACKYSPDSSNIIVEITPHTIICKNDGKIEKDIIENIRTPFWQADKNRWDWVWLWLSLAKEIIRLHHRDISYDSKKDHVICTIDFNN